MVNIDTVYQKVLAFANKEQRGYITPQEFNLYANQAQLEILNQYFYDLDQFGRLNGNNTEYSDMLNLIQEKLSELEVRLVGETVAGNIYNHRDIRDIYRLGSVINSENGVEIEEVNNSEWYEMRSSKLTQPRVNRPVYVNRIDGLNIYPEIPRIDISYIKRPRNVSWGYVVINDTALYDPSISVAFELHEMEEIELVYKILKFAGLSMKREDLMRGSQGLEILQVQQEKK
jgi:hypothetical protein